MALRDVLWLWSLLPVISHLDWSKNLLSLYKSNTISHKGSDHGEHQSDCRNSWLLCSNHYHYVLVYFSQKGAQKFGMGVYIKHALPLQHNFWIMQVLVFAIFAINTVTILYVEHLSNQLFTLYNWCIK